METAGEKVCFEGASGNTLVGKLHLPEGRPKAYALFAHCFNCGKDIKAAVNIGRTLAGCGYGVLRFDFSGVGESQGDFAETTFSSNVEDLIRAADFLGREHRAPRILVGHSLGGTAVLTAASRIPSTVGVVTIGAPAQLGILADKVRREAPEIEAAGEGEIQVGRRKVRVKRRFIENLLDQDMYEAIHGLRKALLVMHAPKDDIVGADNARIIFQAALHPKSFVALDRADHLLTDPAAAGWAGEVIAVWARRYLPEAAARSTAATG